MQAIREFFQQLRHLSAHRSFRLLLIGGTISALGDRVAYIAFLAAVTSASPDTLGIFGISIAEMLPAIVAAPLVSLVVDRFDRRRLMLIADLARGVLFVVVVIVPGIWLLFVIAFLTSSFAVLFDPARQALEPHYLPPDELTQANGMRQSLMSVVLVLGPALGGFIVGAFGFRTALLFDAITFFISAILVAQLDAPAAAIEERNGSMWHEVMGGVRTVRQSPILKHLFGMFAAFMITIGIQFPLIFVFVKQNLGGGPREAGWLFSAVGVGGIVGGLILASMKKNYFDTHTVAGRQRVALMVILDGVVVAIFAGLHIIGPVMLVFAVFGFIGTVLTAALTAAVASQSPEEYRGRVFALYSAMTGPLMVLSIVIGTPFALKYGASSVFYVSGALEIVVGAVTWQLSKRPLKDGLAEPLVEAGYSET